jgi:hypothetical protein
MLHQFDKANMKKLYTGKTVNPHGLVAKRALKTNKSWMAQAKYKKKSNKQRKISQQTFLFQGFSI